MSVPSPYTQRGASAETTEDCRDYLRTGRCKYGASCKYSHPPNVQSGGGMKAPVDPTEPMFPLRPNEPVCTYYMKHGTCKFGQACKFHHPPPSSLTAALVGGGTVVMNVGRKSDVPQIVMNSISGDGTSNGTPMMLQFLPQRPDEQDCIFFLKNGRCKYGATCRYHHPIKFSNQRRRDDGRGQRLQVQQMPEGLFQQFLTQQQPGATHYQQGTSSSSGTHMVVTDGPVTYMTIDGSSGKGSYHPMSVVSNDGYCAPTGAPISHNQDHTSSTSSIASFDTDFSRQEQSSGLWNRKNNGSHASLNAYDPPNGRQRVPIPTSTSDGSIASRNRAASYGSCNDAGAYMDPNSRPPPGAATMPNGASSGSMPSWRTERSQSFDNVRRGVSNQYRPRGDLPGGSYHNESQEQHHPSLARRQPGGRRRSSEAVDDGLSMMTSALLTMIDTPEEAEGYDYDYEDLEQHGGQLPAHRMPMIAAVSQDVSIPRPRDMGGSRSASDGRIYRLDETDQRLDRDFFGVAINSSTMDSRYHDQHAISGEESSGWLPNWHALRPMEGDAQSMSVMQPRHAPPNSPQPSSNVGLYLP